MVQKIFNAFGTLNCITITDNSGEHAADYAANALRDMSARWSVFNSDSEISSINAFAGTGFTQVNQDTYDIIRQSILFSEITNGIFDITVQPLIERYDPREHCTVPAKTESAALSHLTDFRDITLDGGNCAIMLKRPGQKISLGAIAKGYAADAAKALLNEYGIRDAVINIGGTITAIGCPRRVGIRHPGCKTKTAGTVILSEGTASTSGSYERANTFGNKKFCHIFNPRTGEPADSEIYSVTVICKNGAMADALSTAAFACGLHGAQRLCEKTGASAVMIDKDMNVYITKTLNDNFVRS